MSAILDGSEYWKKFLGRERERERGMRVSLSRRTDLSKNDFAHLLSLSLSLFPIFFCYFIFFCLCFGRSKWWATVSFFFFGCSMTPSMWNVLGGHKRFEEKVKHENASRALHEVANKLKLFFSFFFSGQLAIVVVYSKCEQFRGRGRESITKRNKPEWRREKLEYSKIF